MCVCVWRGYIYICVCIIYICTHIHIYMCQYGCELHEDLIDNQIMHPKDNF